MLTSKDTRIDALRGFDAGADAYLTKPADAAEVVRTLLRLLPRPTVDDSADDHAERRDADS
jgi:DNA-binding response OmpR family regulator